MTLVLYGSGGQCQRLLIYPQEITGTNCIEGWASELVWMGIEKLTPRPRFKPQIERPARSMTVKQLLYPSTQLIQYKRCENFRRYSQNLVTQSHTVVMNHSTHNRSSAITCNHHLTTDILTVKVVSAHLQSLYSSSWSSCYRFSVLMICVENQMSHEICVVFQYLLQLRKAKNTQLNIQK
jgi:hypothetical protein